MAKIITVNVTADHVKNGERCDSVGCPVYLAIKEAGLNCEFVSDTHWHDGRNEVGLPVSAVLFITNFDSGNPIKPFSFDIQVSYYTFIKLWIKKLLK